MTNERINEPTPNGGDYSEIFYMDDNDNIVEKEIATKAVIRECRKDGFLICETWLKVE